MKRWLLRWLLPDEVYVVVGQGTPLQAHTTFQGAAEAAGDHVTSVPLVMD